MIVYQIKNLVNGKVYVGQTIQEGNRRWGENHRGKLPEVIAKRRDWISKNKDEFINAIKNGLDTKGKTWKLIDGKRVWMEKI